MHRFVYAIATILCHASISLAQQNTRDLHLPTLHTIQIISLSPSYGCKSTDDFVKGYQTSALFLSNFSKDRNSPDLLFNGACRADDYFQASTAGDDMSLIADLGDGIAIEGLTASKAFNFQEVHSFEAYSKFGNVAKVEANHTYAVLINEKEKRGLFVFTVTAYIPNKRVDLKYAVKAYQVQEGRVNSSEGFEWDQGNSQE